jgi:hypothetical protein
MERKWSQHMDGETEENHYLSQDSWFPGILFNRIPPKYEAGVLTTFIVKGTGLQEDQTLAESV